MCNSTIVKALEPKPEFPNFKLFMTSTSASLWSLYKVLTLEWFLETQITLSMYYLNILILCVETYDKHVHMPTIVDCVKTSIVI